MSMFSSQHQPQTAPSGAIAYFDVQASGWSNHYRYNRHFQTRLNIILEWLTQWPHELSLLDYGCGSGMVMRQLVQSGHRVTGVDQSANMLKEAANNLHNIPERLMPRLMNVSPPATTAYADCTYDGIISLGVLEYVERPLELVEQLATSLKTGGFLMLSVPNQASWLQSLERFAFRHAKWFRPVGLFSHVTGSNSYMQFQQHQFRMSEFTQALSAAGLQLRRIRYHRAPGFLRQIEGMPQIGMTTVLELVKQPAAG